jgi:hypothetical protein
MNSYNHLNDYRYSQNLENEINIAAEIDILDNLFNRESINNLKRPIKTVKKNKLIQWFASIDEQIDRFDVKVKYYLSIIILLFKYFISFMNGGRTKFSFRRIC